MAALPRTLEDKLLAAVARHDMLARGHRVLVAVSGGQDSLALLHALHGLRGRLEISLHAAHLHHGIRGAEADADLEFLRGLCGELGVPLVSDRVSVPGMAQERRLSVEEAGRAARREFLTRAAGETGCRRIATAHTATDRAETVLMNILRGAGLDGLQGIRPVAGQFIRPLIGVTRGETADYCRSHGLQPRLDRTNLDTDLLRNRIRLRLMPLLEAEYATGAEAALLRLAQAAEAEVSWTEDLVREALEAARSPAVEGLLLDLQVLAALPDGLLQRVLREAVGEVQGDLTGLTMAHVDSLAALAREGRTGARVCLPFEVWAQREYNGLRIARGRLPESGPGEWETDLPVPGRVALPPGGAMVARLRECPSDFGGVRPEIEAYLARGAVGAGLKVRNWREGDRVPPLGMAGRRKLQDLFVDARIPRRQRGCVPIVVNGDGQILWVAGLCVSRLAAVGPGDVSCVHLSWEPDAGLGGPHRAATNTGG